MNLLSLEQAAVSITFVAGLIALVAFILHLGLRKEAFRLAGQGGISSRIRRGRQGQAADGLAGQGSPEAQEETALATAADLDRACAGTCTCTCTCARTTTRTRRRARGEEGLQTGLQGGG
jgi:hypothetical protein